MKHILFTGAAGYIGSHTALAFLRQTDCKITIIDNLKKWIHRKCGIFTA